MCQLRAVCVLSDRLLTQQDCLKTNESDGVCGMYYSDNEYACDTVRCAADRSWHC